MQPPKHFIDLKNICLSIKARTQLLRNANLRDDPKWAGEMGNRKHG